MPDFVMIVGLPGSGKSTFAKEYFSHGYKIHSSDKLRLEMFGDAGCQEHNEELFKELHKRIKNDLKNGFNVVYDACNISAKRRRALLQEFKKIKCKKISWIIATPYMDCIRNNDKRDRKVPIGVIIGMYKSIKIPHESEGWDCVNIKFNCTYKRNAFRDVLLLRDFRQDNPHHDMTLGIHALQSALSTNIVNSHLMFDSALLHDIGKPFCKTFVNTHNEIESIAHYYGHENVGAYDSMFYGIALGSHEYMSSYILNNILLERANVIQYHMMPYAWEVSDNAKLRNKYARLWGRKLFEEIMMIHKADMEAH